MNDPLMINSVHPNLIALVPFYEDSESAEKLIEDLYQIIPTIYILAIDDGSLTSPLLQDRAATLIRDGVIITLNRNMGHQRAIATGLAFIAQHFPSSSVVVMDGDGEDRPNSIPILIETQKKSGSSITVAMRNKRSEGFNFKVFYFLYKNIFKAFSGKNINFGNFMLLTPAAIKRLTSMHELWTHLAGTVLVSKLSISSCSIDRGVRYAGKSKMNFISLVLHGFRLMMIFAEEILARIGIFCAAVATLSFTFALIVLTLKLLDMATPGWASVLISIFFLIFIQTGAITLLSLLLIGTSRNNQSIPDYQKFIENITYLKK